MSLLREKDQNAVKDKFSKELINPVLIKYFYSEEDKSDGTRITKELLEEVTKLADGKLILEMEASETVAIENGIDKTPAILIKDSTNDQSNIRFFGLPAGHEFASFLHTVISVSRNYSTDLSRELIDKIKKINKPVKIQVFVTTSCPHCPPAVIASHYFAMINPLIVSEMIEANQFNELSMKYGVQSVPMVIINDGARSFVGSRSPEDLFELISETA
jgi:glutaredoxin-like protein